MLAGHAGAMLQARRLGNELIVGLHSDEAILEHKGPTVMTLNERLVIYASLAHSSSFVTDLDPFMLSGYLQWKHAAG